MKKHAFIVIRRNGYYINIVPNEESVLAAWVNDNVIGLNLDLPFAKKKKLLALRGYSFHTVPGSALADLKAYSKTM